MALFTVGPNSTFPSIAAAMAAAGPGDTIQLEAGYSNETALVTHSGMIITGGASSVGIVLQLGIGIATVTLAGTAPINLLDASDGNGIVGNDGDNVVTVTAGADAVNGGTGHDLLFVDYREATGAVTGDSLSNIAEAGGGGRLVTINGGFEDFTIWTGSGADTITTGDGDDDIRTGEGAGTITAGEGANYIIGGSGADTIVAGSGGNFVNAGDGTNTITTGGGIDQILSGTGADTIAAGAGQDRITVTGGSDTVNGGADGDLLIVDYSAAVTAVSGGVTGGNLGTGYTGHLADLVAASLDFVETEQFWITTGTGDDTIRTGAAEDRITTGAGNDLLMGGAGNDLLTGGDGNDLIYGEGGIDTARGGAGNDTFVVDASTDIVEEAYGEGNDSVLTQVSYLLTSGAEVELLSTTYHAGTAAIELTGNYGNQTIIGNAGNNVITGGVGADVLIGLAGDDVYIVHDGAASVIEDAGSGNDTVFASTSFALGAEAEVETISTTYHLGTAAIDLSGSRTDQTIFGNGGANVLDGKAGNDVMVGFGGADTFAFTSALGAGNVDTIADFLSGTDKIALDDAIFTALPGGSLAAGAFVTGSAAGDADDRIIYNSATGALSYDADGNGAGAAVQFATLTNHPMLTASDFLMI
jgi:Ca2+-binding RTX toxin-like protein